MPAVGQFQYLLHSQILQTTLNSPMQGQCNMGQKMKARMKEGRTYREKWENWEKDRWDWEEWKEKVKLLRSGWQLSISWALRVLSVFLV